MLGIIQAAGWPIWPLLACSIVALAIMFERLYSLQTKRVLPMGLLDEVLAMTQPELMKPESIQQLKAHCALGEILVSGLIYRRSQPQVTESDFRAVVQASGRRVHLELDKHLNALGSIASVAPLLGLFGTVVGIIKSFGELAGGPAGGAGVGAGAGSGAGRAACGATCEGASGGGASFASTSTSRSTAGTTLNVA